MRECLFHGKSVLTDEWVCGSLIHVGDYCCIIDENAHDLDVPYMNGGTGCIDGYAIPVVPESVGEWTGMNEFMLTDESRNAPLFEGDIVEVWGWRVPVSTYNPKSQSDGRIKVRAVICFKHGQWRLDYDNEYNKALAKLKGKETDRRVVDGSLNLYYYGYHGSDIEGYRAKELEWHGKFHNKEDIVGHNDIVKIGTVFEDADLLEG